MSLKRRLQNLECQPVRKSRPKTDPESTRRLLAAIQKVKAEWVRDPEGCELRRQEGLRKLGFDAADDPTWQAVLRRHIDQRDAGNTGCH